MGYYLMPEAVGVEINVELLAAEATRVFIKNHGMPTAGLDIGVNHSNAKSSKSSTR